MFGRIWGKKALFEIKSGIMTVNYERTTSLLPPYFLLDAMLPSFFRNVCPAE